MPPKNLSFEEILEKVKSTNFEIVEEFTPKNVHIEVMVKCKTCKTVHEKRLNSLLHGYGCNHCNKTNSRTVKSFRKELKELTNGEYELVNESNEDKKLLTRKPIELFHNVCKKHFSLKLHAFVTLNQRCPHCFDPKNSKGIQQIKETLEFLQLDYEVEKTFKTLKNKKRLPLDIYIPKLNTVIEYDGEQHFKPVKAWGGEDKLQYTKTNDEIKNKWCEENNVTLIRIPYTETKIKLTLINKLHQLGTFND